jgi:hypothetical protein
MRGGIFNNNLFTIIYDAGSVRADHAYIPKSGSWKCLTLNFSKNMFQNRECHTLKLTFDLNAMLILNFRDYYSNINKYLDIPSIINGLFNSIFGYEYVVSVNDNGNILVENASGSIQFNYHTGGLASPSSIDSLHLANLRKDGSSTKLKNGVKFTQDCVIELEFCPSGDATTVQLKKFTTFDEGTISKLWGWSTKSPENEVITVNKKIDEVVANINKLVNNENKNVYLLLPGVLRSIHQTSRNKYINDIDEQFYWLDKEKFDEHKKTILKKYAEEKAQKEAKEKAERDKYWANFEQEIKEREEAKQKEIEEFAKLPLEQQEAIKKKREAEEAYQDYLNSR